MKVICEYKNECHMGYNCEHGIEHDDFDLGCTYIPCTWMTRSNEYDILCIGCEDFKNEIDRILDI